MSLRPLFVTQVYEASLADAPDFAAFNESLADACRMLAAEDLAGRIWCREHGYRGYTSYGSLTDLPQRMPEFAELKRRLDRHALACASALNFDLARRPRLNSLWVNILKPGGGHSGHIHPHAFLSGTVYLEVPDGASALKLEDPRLPMMMARPAVHADAPEAERPFVYLTPKAGTVLIWESWLRHEVPVNAAKSERISVSFNYA
ncbi:TIGR02466 family protein [Brevundimonas sp.]|uniref:TIGR02466 family protein n=1 Tax=Brevundimonas sp. TaxID=1871086 RepID=UPI002D5232AE|nr:TIGR02466 family protein [Brevundimonas sp.]HYC75831.1 TIGR02466 family protein [Brevundimonas sp.]